MSDLADKRCVPCEGGVPPLPEAEQAVLRQQLHEDWIVVKGHHLYRRFRTPDFRTALDLAGRIGEEAEAQAHHPDLTVAWGRLEVTIWTHKIDGLTESDFILAARIDRREGQV